MLGLLGAVLVLLSELNARTYRMSVVDGKLVIDKGRLLPFGTEAYRPQDLGLQDAYAPLDLRGHSVGMLTEQSFNERDELDRALFGVMQAVARPLVKSDKPQELDQGLEILRRMEKLPGAHLRAAPTDEGAGG